MHMFLSLFERVDRVVALRMTAKYIFHPLYKDYSVVGRVVGFIFRTLRIIIGVVVYAVLGIACLGVYAAWVALPLAVIFFVFHHFDFAV